MRPRPTRYPLRVENGGYATDIQKVTEAQRSDTEDQVPAGRIGVGFEAASEGIVMLNTLDGPDAGSEVRMPSAGQYSGLLFTRIRQTGTTVEGDIYVLTSEL